MMPISRQTIIARALAKYPDESNVTTALDLYLQNDAGPDEQIPLFITSPEIHQIQKILAQIRPTCDECGAELFLQVLARDPDGNAHPTAWICKKCGIHYYSELSPAEWLKELELETRNQNLRKPDEPGRPEMSAVR